MNRITAFSNAAEFQALFGKTEHGTRRNAILLQLLKSKKIWEWCKKNDDYGLLSTQSMTEMKKRVFTRLDLCSTGNFCICLKGWERRRLFSDKYATDEYNGIPLDETASTGDFIRYINKETDKVYKMRSGKFLRKVILESEFGRALPEQVLTWMLEELVSDWRVQCANEVPKYNLVIDDDFHKIYSRRYCCGSFGSCMTDNDYYSFYSDAVDAKAASLRDENGIIIARCVIFTDVKDEDGKTWRLAERQYATKELHKQLLVNALIDGGHIDGYKRVGADCGAANSFVSNDGEDLSHKDFSIRCNLDWGDTVSYQDSFKWYSMEERRAYNYSECDYDECLDTTSGHIAGDWDDWHDRYVRETETVYYQGCEYQCDIDELDEFSYIFGDYYYNDDILECPECGDQFLDPNHYDNNGHVYSELTGDWYCCERCKEMAEREYKETWWHYSDIDDEYYEHKSELSDVLIWNDLRNGYVIGKVRTKNINWHIKHGNLFIHNGVLADDISRMLNDDRIAEELERMYVELKIAG